jgi:hypothetical protein
MDELNRLIQDLEILANELAEKYTQMQSATEELTASVGKGDVVKLAAQVGSASQAYNEVRERTVTLLQLARQALHEQGKQARNRGVDFPYQEIENSNLNREGGYSASELIESIDKIKVGSQALADSVYNFFQEQIGARLANAKTELTRLARLDSESVELADLLHDMQIRFENKDESRESILSDAESLVLSCHNQVVAVLQAKSLILFNEGTASFSRLQVFGIQSQDDVVALAVIEKRLSDPDEELLNDLTVLRNLFRQRAEQSKNDQIAHIDRLTDAAIIALAELHPQWPEAVALADLLQSRDSITDASLSSYLAQLTKVLGEAHDAGLNALKRYEDQIVNDSGYLFRSLDELEQIGVAILSIAEKPDYDLERLWTIGYDCMLRATYANFDAEDFYTRFGYTSIALALRESIKRREMVSALSFLDTEFLPPKGASQSERIDLLLSNSAIADIFDEIRKSDAWRINPEFLKTLSKTHHHALLTLLEHANQIALPVRIQLQWLSVLDNTVSMQSEMSPKIKFLFLKNLLQAEDYVLFYYSLKALGHQYPDLLSIEAFRPALEKIVAQALEYEVGGQQFLIEFALAPEVNRLASGDFGVEFLLAALAHHATVNWGQVTLLTESWALWNKLLGDYPILADLLHRNLNGEQFSKDIVLDYKKLSQDHEKSINLIENRLSSMRSRGALVGEIFRWYEGKYFKNWLQTIQASDLALDQLDILLTEVSNLQKSRDLVDDCPKQHQPPRSGMKLEPLEGRLKSQTNSRLVEILRLYQDSLKMQRQIISVSRHNSIEGSTLALEISDINNRSTTAMWAIEHLLTSELPFLSNLLPAE